MIRDTLRSALCGLALGGLSLGLALPAQAQSPELVVKYGQASSNDYQRSGIGLRFDPLWSATPGTLQITLRPELELSQLHYSGNGSGPTQVSEGGAIGMLRIQHAGEGIRPYAEVGLGLALFSNDRIGQRDLSSHGQFSEHIGVGLDFDQHWSLGLMYSHYSNGGLKQPNNGIDLQQIVLGVRF